MKKKTQILGLAVIAVILLVVAFAYSSGMFLSAEEKAAKANADIISDVRSMMRLPEGEPAIFEVKDPAEVQKQQPFFEGVVEGDKLLVFPEQAKAVIYSPSRKIIVNSGPINFDQNAQGQTQTPAGTEQLSQ